MGGDIGLTSEDAELAVAGCIMGSVTALAEVVDKCHENDFAHGAPRAVYAAARWLFEHGQAVDPTTVRATVLQMRRGGSGGGDDGVGVCLDAAADPNNIRDYIAILKDRSLRRAARSALDDTAAALYEVVDTQELLDRAERNVFALRDEHGHRGRKFASAEDLAEWFDSYLAGDEKAVDTWPYPLASAQRQIGGLAPGELSVLAGYSGDGKSVMALQHLEAACRAGARVGYWSLEMPERQIQRRLVAMSGISVRSLRDRTLTDSEIQKARARLTELRTFQYDVYAGTCTMDQIRAAQMRHRYDIVIIDHLHRMNGSEDRQALERIVRSGKDLALDTSSAVLALAQLARRDGFPPPTTNQLRGTDVLTQEADTVCFVYRDRDEAAQRLDSGQYLIAKVRDGESDTSTPIKFLSQSMSFVDMEIAILPKRVENLHVGAASGLSADEPERSHQVKLPGLRGGAAEDSAADYAYGPGYSEGRWPAEG